MSITLKHLRSFAEVARQGNFTRAAQALSLSQPALTITIHQFEDLIGVKLFDRTTRRVRLTSEGEEFLPTARRVLEDFDHAIAGIREVAERRRGRVGVATLPSVAVRLLPEVIARFTQSYPGIHVHLHDDNASGIQRRVRRNEVDFGISSRWEVAPDLDFSPLMSDPFGMVCRADHPLAQRTGAITWQELGGYTFLGLAPDTGIRPLMQAVGDLPENIRVPQYEASNIATVEGMLAAGLGITALPALAVSAALDRGLVFRNLTMPAIEREICLVTRKGRSLSPAASTLRDLILDTFPRRWDPEHFSVSDAK